MKQLPFRKQLLRLGKLSRPITKHHYFIATITILVFLIVAVLLTTQTLNSSTDDAYRTQKESESIRARFDQQTIEKIKKLQSSSEQTSEPIAPPANTRINPFAE